MIPMRVSFAHEIDNNPGPDDVGTITFNARIFRGEPEPVTFSTWCFADEYRDDEHHECPSKEGLNIFLMFQEITNADIDYALDTLIDYVEDCAESSEYSPGCALTVWLDFVPEDDPSQVRPSFREQGAQATVDENGHLLLVDFILTGALPAARTEQPVPTLVDGASNIIQSKPANKHVVQSLPRSIYKQAKEECPICLEEFSDGAKIVSLPCGHDFDEDCVVKWFGNNHVCPLCRYELPCEV